MTHKDDKQKKKAAPPAKEEAHMDGAEKERPPEELLEECAQQAAEYLAGWKRAQADYQNLMKETERKVQENIKYATENLLHELLPIVDHFNYAFKGVPEAERDSGWLKGMEHIQTNFLRILEGHGVEMMKTVGEEFNPELHESVEEVEVEGGRSGTIAEEVSAGFLLNGKVVRHAAVKIVK